MSTLEGTTMHPRYQNGHGFGILTWKHVGTQKIQLKISGWLSIPICLPGGRGCIIRETGIRWNILPVNGKLAQQSKSFWCIKGKAKILASSTITIFSYLKY